MCIQQIKIVNWCNDGGGVVGEVLIVFTEVRGQFGGTTSQYVEGGVTISISGQILLQ